MSTTVTPVTSTVDTTTPSIDSTAPLAAAPVKARPRYVFAPKIRKGTYKTKARRIAKKAGFRVKFRYTYGKKNRVVKQSVNKYWKRYPRSKWNKNHTRRKYKRGTVLTITLGNGKKPRPWKSGVATWYSIADNTPAGSRATSSGRPLGSYGGWTFASRNFPMGTKLLIKRGKRQHVVICTDRGGLETIDLYKPASDRMGMGGKSSFKYQVIRKGW